MALRQQISDALKEAVEAKDRTTTSTLRLVNAALKDRDIAARSAGAGNGGITDEEILDLFAKMVRQREEAAEQYRAGGRPALAEREHYEIEVIRRFMPRQLSQQETEQVVAEVIAETGASGLKDMGRVMAALKQGWPGQIDGAVASALVKKKLG
jgi:uncharacterized protein YqeY